MWGLGLDISFSCPALVFKFYSEKLGESLCFKKIFCEAVCIDSEHSNAKKLYVHLQSSAFCTAP
eukprot:9240174-Pyramimonas_sp.AAC.1